LEEAEGIQHLAPYTIHYSTVQNFPQKRLEKIFNSFSGKVLKGKWKNLKDKLRIEVNKIPGSRSGAENVDCTSKWLFFDMMLFVKDTILPSPTTGNLLHIAPSQLMDDDSEDYMEDTLDNDNTAGDRALPSTVIPLPRSTGKCYGCSSLPAEPTQKSQSRKRRQLNPEVDLYLEMEPKKLDIITVEQKKDEELTSKHDYHFLISLLPYLEKLSSLENLEVRGKIQDVVIQAYKHKEEQMHEELEISQLSLPGVQNNHLFTYNIPQY
jgi:hypothetical protein